MMKLSFFAFDNRAIAPLVAVSLVLLLVSCSGSRKTTNKYETIVVKPADPSLTLPNANAEQKLAAKYAACLKSEPDSITNMVLYAFIDKWMKTPYKYGGNDERGIDCSGFIQRLLGDVYNIQVPRTSAQQFFTKNVEPFHDKTYFSEGDLVFFSTVPGNPISHVGMYLRNRYFINASTSSGVSIASLDDAYWKKRFVAAGRVRIVKAAPSKPATATKTTSSIAKPATTVKPAAGTKPPTTTTTQKPKAVMPKH